MSLRTTIDNPSGNALSYEWTQTGGITLLNTIIANTFARMPSPTLGTNLVTATITVTDTVTEGTSAATITLQVVPQITPSNSLFNRSTGSTPGLMWIEFSQPFETSAGIVQVIQSDVFEGRGNSEIVSDYVGTSPAYVTYLAFHTNGTLRLYLDDINDDANLGVGAGPQFTNDAEQDFGLAVITPDGTLRTWNGDDLVASDSTDPYSFSSASVNNAGPENNQTLRDALASFWSVGVLLVDRTHSDISWPAATTSATAVLPPEMGTPGARGGGTQVTNRPWPLTVSVTNRNGNRPPMHDMQAQASSYSWTAYGGPQAATIQITGSARALQSVLAWTNYNVIISDPAGPVWWGYIEKVTLSDGAWIVDSSIERQYNAIRTHEQPHATMPPSAWTEDAASIDRFGRRELSLQLNDDIDPPTNAEMRELLEPYTGAHQGIEHSRSGKLGVTLHCRGYVAKLDWQYTARFSVGQYGDVSAFPQNVDGSVDWWWHDAAGANDDFEWAQFADFQAANTADVPTYAQYLSRIRFWQWRTGRTDTGRDFRFRLRSGGAGEEPGSIITSEHNFTDLGGVDPSSSGSVIDLDWATNVSPETLLPSEGWYFTLWQSQARLQMSRSHKDHLYWDSVRGAPDLNGTTRLWWRAFSGVPQNLVNVWQAHTLHLNFDFFTRLSTTAMVQEILSHHGHIDFVGLHPTRKQTFDAYLPGTQKVGELVQQLAEFDDLFYWINPTRQLQVYRADRNSAFPITMRDDGRVQGRRQTDLSFVGKWIRYRGISALCTSARFNTRAGTLDVSFRGVPSAGQIRQQLLTR